MAELRVWSEQGEAPGTGGLNDCTYSANLMVLVAAGKNSFPLGIYTKAERDSLETFNANPNEIGGNHGFTDTAILAHYGITMRKVVNGTRDVLRAELSKTGKAFAVAGRCQDRPARLGLKACSGPHDVCLVPQGNGKVLWLDPMEPMGARGKVATVDEVLAYAFFPPGGNDARFLKIGELASQEEMVDPIRHIPLVDCSVASGGTVYLDPERRTILIQSWVGQDTVGLYAGSNEPSGGHVPLVPIRIQVGGKLHVGWVGSDKVSNIRLRPQ